MESITSKGLTFIELLTTLSIIATLTIASTGLSNLYNQWQYRLEVRNLYNLTNTARETAVHTRSFTAICPASDNFECKKSWPANYYMVFMDSNNNTTFDKNEHIVRIGRVPEAIEIKWKAFGNKAALRFTPEGVTDDQNGRFVVCHKSIDNLGAASIIINKAGRARLVFAPKQTSACADAE